MSPETQPLESFFKSIQSNEGLPGDFDNPTGNQDGEFDAFFAKLSSLEDLNWSDEPGPESVAAEEKPAPVPKRNRVRTTVRPKVTPPRAKKPAMQVIHNEIEPEPGPEQEPDPYQWRKELLDAPAPSTLNETSRRLKTAGKFALMASLLFALGLGAGWLALSLPERYGKKMPGVAVIMEGRKMISEEVIEVTAMPGGIGWSTKSDHPVTVTAATPANVPVQPGNGALPGKKNPVAAAAAAVADSSKTAPPAAKEAVSPVKPAAGLKPAGRYSLQVGACQSNDCVERYRQLLLSYVSPAKIQVIVRPHPNGRDAIRRVRIAPLNRDDAGALQKKLKSANGNFKDAYMTALH